MDKENKELLLKDLCARLPYGVKCQFEDTVRIIDGESSPFYDYILSARHLDLFINNKDFYVKPYLRPMSSMTYEEKIEYLNTCGNEMENPLASPRYSGIDYLNSIHVDYRGLIEKGLAIKVTKENNPYKD